MAVGTEKGSDMAKTATANPFAAAAANAKKPGTVKDNRPIFVASDLTGENGQIIYTAADVREAIVNFTEGHTLFEQATAMKDASRPVVENFTRYRFSQEWVKRGVRPENPALNSEPTGGTTMKVVYMDSSKKLDDAQFEQLASVIGRDNADANVIRRHEFGINPDVLDQSVKVNKNGKVVEQNVMEALTEALQEKFGPSPDILAVLFTATEKFQTKKGLIDKALQLVKPDPNRIADFLEAGRFTVQLKTGSASNE